MTSKERIITALKGEQPDRVPVTIYEMDRYGKGWATREPSYQRVLELGDELGDTFHFAHIGNGLKIGDANAVREEAPGTNRSGETETVIETPKGPLTMISRRDPSMMTSWVVKHYIENREDIDRFSSIEPIGEPPDLTSLYDSQAEIGENGVVAVSIGDTFGTLSGMFDFPLLAMTVVEDFGLIKGMLDRIHGPLLAAVKDMASRTENVIYRFWGAEYCGAPLLNPGKYFEDLVVRYDQELVDAVAGTGNFSMIHCHGKLDAILEMIADTGADAMEPIETLPTVTADVTMRQVKERVGDRMCLMGGMQSMDLELLPPKDLEQQIRATIEEGAPGGGFVLLPTAMPIDVPLPEEKAANIETYLRAGRSYGVYA